MNPHLIQQAIERTQNAMLLATVKPSPKGSGGGSSSVEPPMPLPVGIISAKRELRDVLLLWTDLVSDGMDVVANCDPTDTSMLEWLSGNERATFLATHDAAGDFLDELTTITKSLENPYLPRFGRKYLGFHGGGDVYVKEGQTEVTLADGTIERVDTIRTWSAQHVLDWTGTAQEVAKAIKDYFGHDITPKQIANARDKDSRRAKENGLKSLRKIGKDHVYRLGDVLDRLVTKELSPKT